MNSWCFDLLDCCTNMNYETKKLLFLIRFCTEKSFVNVDKEKRMVKKRSTIMTC